MSATAYFNTFHSKWRSLPEPPACSRGDVTMAFAPRLVVLRPPGLGDVLAVVPALRALAAAFPGHHRILVAPAVFAPLIDAIGAVHELVDTPNSRGIPLGPPCDLLEGGDVDIAVDLHGEGPASQRWLLATRPRRLIAFAHHEVPETRGAPQWRSGEYEVHRWCRLLNEHGVPADPTDLDLYLSPWEAEPGMRGATIIHPGASCAGRHWPVERFAAVARAEVEAGRTVLVTGGPHEVELARRLAYLAELPRSSILAGRTDLLELARLVAVAARVVVGDTGVAHLATALRTPSVVLCGPVPPTEWGPPPDRPWHRALWAGLRGDPHGPTLDPSLAAIQVPDVLQHLAMLPESIDRK
ncbi:glycosyltransferase family 9 protein [Nonomuraea insulae]|uniref:Glycosyltransferase family 9 protein n=1 Tax=Nonomuraea insulae TaxID=1616787 RepID=A0ABW1D689_9ACTN